MTDRRTPPLWCMAVGVGIAAALLLVLGWPFLRDGDSFENELRSFHLEQVRQATQLQPEAQVFVIVGGSNIKHAFLPDDAGFPQAGADAGISQAKLVRLTGNGGMRIIDEEFQAAVIALKPEVLLIQDHALFFPNWYRLQLAYTRYIRERIGRFIGVRRLGKTVRAQVLAEDAAINFQDRQIPNEELLARLRVARAREPIVGPRDDLMQVIKACRLNGSQVLVLPIPCDPRWSVFPADELEDVERILAQLTREGLIEVLSCPLKFEAADFPDLRHMTLPARQRYTQWLLGELASKMKR